MKKRTRLWVDPSVQGALIVRLLVYWAACMIFVTLPLALIYATADPGKFLHRHFLDLLSRHWPILAALTAMIPFFIYDTTRFSHRFVGPISLLRRKLARYEQGARVFPIEFRRGDFWKDVVDRINNVIDRAETAEKKLAEIEAAAPANLPACEFQRDLSTYDTIVG